MKPLVSIVIWIDHRYYCLNETKRTNPSHVSSHIMYPGVTFVCIYGNEKTINVANRRNAVPTMAFLLSPLTATLTSGVKAGW